MKAKHLLTLLTILLMISCEDSTPEIGKSITADGDKIEARVSSYEATTRSVRVDSVFNKTNTLYLGRYTDPDYGLFSTGILAQFYCGEDVSFPEELTEITGMKLVMGYKSYFGNPDAGMHIAVEQLNKLLPEQDKSIYYSDIDPANYYDTSAAPLGSKTIAPTGLSVDTIYASTKQSIHTVELPVKLARDIYEKSRKENGIKNVKDFLDNYFKGVYIHCDGGDGAIFYIDDLTANITFKGLIESKTTGKRDSLVYGQMYFPATEEVIQTSIFDNGAQLDKLVGNDDCTYLKTPSGIVTEVTLPIAEIATKNAGDTINAASINFTCYNKPSGIKYPMQTPQDILMVRKKEMHSFFEMNKIIDNKTSYIAKYDPRSNQYNYLNISQLIQTCINERRAGLAADKDWETRHPDWDKVMLIPIQVTREISGSPYGGGRTEKITQIKNQARMSSIRLVGGKNKIKLNILTTKYSKK